MTPAEFTAWIDAAKADSQWTQRDCAAALTVDPGQITRWKANGAPAYIALAIAAIEAGLPPWRGINSPTPEARRIRPAP